MSCPFKSTIQGYSYIKCLQLYMASLILLVLFFSKYFTILDRILVAHIKG